VFPEGGGGGGGQALGCSSPQQNRLASSGPRPQEPHARRRQNDVREGTHPRRGSYLRRLLRPRRRSRHACGRGCRRPFSRCRRCRGCGHDAAEDVAAQWVWRLGLTESRSTNETRMTSTGEGDRHVAGVRLLARGECAVSASSLCRPRRPTMTPPQRDRQRRLLGTDRCASLGTPCPAVAVRRSTKHSVLIEWLEPIFRYNTFFHVKLCTFKPFLRTSTHLHTRHRKLGAGNTVKHIAVKALNSGKADIRPLTKFTCSCCSSFFHSTGALWLRVLFPPLFGSRWPKTSKQQHV